MPTPCKLLRQSVPPNVSGSTSNYTGDPTEGTHHSFDRSYRDLPAAQCRRQPASCPKPLSTVHISPVRHAHSPLVHAFRPQSLSRRPSRNPEQALALHIALQLGQDPECGDFARDQSPLCQANSSTLIQCCTKCANLALSGTKANTRTSSMRPFTRSLVHSRPPRAILLFHETFRTHLTPSPSPPTSRLQHHVTPHRNGQSDYLACAAFHRHFGMAVSRQTAPASTPRGQHDKIFSSGGRQALTSEVVIDQTVYAERAEHG
ncbi:MAG: hypothetical protein FE78DRAFT_106992 [Acidomyces sp. 'richmondensis']|nr:MAG: hypothetical protein FE78DRAFT_106992 [Acidomyces sp. 'richmondensis']